MSKSEILELFYSKVYFSFSFKKKDGTLRYAIGTVDQDFISEYWKPTDSGGYEEPEDIIRYFDVDALAWRSFRVDSFIQVED